KTVQTKVGDRYVMEEMRKGGFNLGGEQSGHIIFLDHGTTGDGMLTAVQLVNVLTERQEPLSELARIMQKYPQHMVNVRVKEKNGWDRNSAIRAAVDKVEEALGSNGRV